MRRLALFFVLLVSVARADDGLFQQYGNPVSAATMEELMAWGRRLPAVANLGRAFIGCAVRTHSGPDRFNADFEACWSGYDRVRSCAYRCGGPYHVYGYYSPSALGPGAIRHVIFCRCDNVVHDYQTYPVPAVVPKQ